MYRRAFHYKISPNFGSLETICLIWYPLRIFELMNHTGLVNCEIQLEILVNKNYQLNKLSRNPPLEAGHTIIHFFSQAHIILFKLARLGRKSYEKLLIIKYEKQ